ncbi:hypothetical protein Tco_0140759 [Tanacetum coccineum]
MVNHAGRDVDPERELKWRNLELDAQQQDFLTMLFNFHVIDDEDFKEEPMDGQDMDAEDVDLEELVLRIMADYTQRDDMLIAQFDFHETDDEHFKEELMDGEDTDVEDFGFHETDDDDFKKDLMDVLFFSSRVPADYVPAGHVLISADRYRIC